MISNEKDNFSKKITAIKLQSCTFAALNEKQIPNATNNGRDDGA
ncbi:MAG: hypothetical protein RBR47_13545 [Bacteroidales bacterium]|jgi:hypothetical protein|nr:hypothetical protein [Bacteroidales bacterium]MDY0335972.1 hypothetical protein [Bacteroidales bacterium]